MKEEKEKDKEENIIRGNRIRRREGEGARGVEEGEEEEEMPKSSNQAKWEESDHSVGGHS